MNGKKILNVLVILVLVTSAFGIIFSSVAEGQETGVSDGSIQASSANSMVMTTESDYSTPKDYFYDNTVYYYGEVRDADGNPPQEAYDVIVQYTQENGGTSDYNYHRRIDNRDGTFSGQFEIEQEGNYNLTVYGEQDNYEILATDTFSVINQDVQVTVDPSYQSYSQGQDIEIQLAGDYDQPLNLTIEHTETGERMEGAYWYDIELGSRPWTAEYQIPEEAEGGYYWINATDYDTGEVRGQFILEVRRYYIDAGADKNSYLPKEDVTVNYNVIDNLDGSPYNEVDVEYLVRYYHVEDGWSSITGDAEGGEFTFELPRYAQTNTHFDIEIWANSTEGDHEVHTTLGNLYVSDFDLDLSLDKNTYLPEETLYVDIDTGPEVEVELELNDDEDQTVEEKEVVTDSNGQYTVTFDLSGMETGNYNITGGAVWDIQREITASDIEPFEIVQKGEDYSIHMHSDKRTYYPGESGTVFYTVSDRNGTEIEDPNIVYTLRSTTGRTFDKGHGEDGEIAFEVPASLDPALEDLEILVEDGTEENKYTGSIRLSVSPGEIMLNPDQAEYQAGDTVEFDYSFAGIESGDIDSLEYKIHRPDGTLVESETPSDGSFTFEVPDIPENYYEVELIAITQAGTRLDTTREITRVSDYSFMVEIISDPKHTSGYEPGEEIEVDYKLVSNTEKPLPETLAIYYDFGGQQSELIHTDETDGTFTITVPELKSGEHMLIFQVNFDIGDYGNDQMLYQSVQVDSDPSMMDRSVVGSISLADVGIGLVILIALILGALAYARSGGSGKGPERKPGHEPSETPPMSEPEEGTIEEEGSGEEFIVEEGEAEPENQWTDESQIEPGERD